MRRRGRRRLARGPTHQLRGLAVLLVAPRLLIAHHLHRLLEHRLLVGIELRLALSTIGLFFALSLAALGARQTFLFGLATVLFFLDAL